MKNNNVAHEVQYLPSRKSKSLVKIAVVVLLITLTTAVFTQNIYATLDTGAGQEQFNQLIEFIATWIGRIAGVVMLLGGIQLGLALKSQSPDEKVNALFTLGAGALVFGITQAYTFFTNFGS